MEEFSNQVFYSLGLIRQMVAHSGLKVSQNREKFKETIIRRNISISDESQFKKDLT